jgi:hypothetical protein
MITLTMITLSSFYEISNAALSENDFQKCKILNADPCKIEGLTGDWLG